MSDEHTPVPPSGPPPDSPAPPPLPAMPDPALRPAPVRLPPFRSIEGLSRVVLGSLLLCSALDMAGIYLGFNQINLIADLRDGVEVTNEEISWNDDTFALIAISRAFATLLTATMFLIWMYRACANQRAFGVRRIEFSPKAAIWWWFCPIMNLIRPFGIMREIWGNSARASASDMSVRVARSSPWIGWWWGVWLVQGVLAQITTMIYQRALNERIYDHDKVIRATEYVMGSEALTVISAVLAMLLVAKLTRMQQMAGGRRRVPEGQRPAY